MLRVRAKGVTGWSLCVGPVQVNLEDKIFIAKKIFGVKFLAHLSITQNEKK